VENNGAYTWCTTTVICSEHSLDRVNAGEEEEGKTWDLFITTSRGY
jgi:hypothetical protein